jgi:hypothetical protein
LSAIASTCSSFSVNFLLGDPDSRRILLAYHAVLVAIELGEDVCTVCVILAAGDFAVGVGIGFG